ncbi:ead/Ea22-like family protein [Citrobacter freundii]|uniref:ead/Ea22-like family protein n=1 Tax=Citrobacter freundii TaxID=546 RepID=UPI00200E72E9|nr:ead/Ea22-like family protein [Citrobacter freundii]UQI38035.1 ead/Ea22-like family protein [Citrobacter freundii]
MTSREKFEQAIKSRFGDLIDYRVCKNSDGEYMAWDMQVAWWAWQAAETDLAVQLANAESKCRELALENAYIRNRYKELDLLIGKNILVMQAAIIEWQATGDAKNGLSWIYNTLFGPGELPDESEKDAQAYFDRKYAPIDEELMALHKWFWEQSEAERAAAGIGVKGE